MIGAGGAALTLAPALPADTRIFSRRGDWPPSAEGCDLIVNATPVRDELLVSRGGADGRRPRLRGRRRETALVAAARAAGCEVDRRARGARPPGRERASSSGPGVAAPVEVMRDAVRGLAVLLRA